ncbi:DUF6318 family protein [Aeromicrobium fastidiosum]|uniref:DUF6318 family protein n=1 Tax=Aeromicrobium fastidiosum TaxID=52699 RepID=UPI002023666D|nr:DUF6318 family protein [Aeromicrobium fastidiosum]MCL8251022.1 DUF6318 family protein [Aeromicrobium fastidiosum]
MRFGGIVLVTALTLAACSSDPAPREPDPTRSASAAPTPTATLPTMPPQASEDSPEGAAAFVKHYVDVFNYAAATGDVDELSRLSSPDCEGCQSYIDLYRDTYEAGGYFRGGDWTVDQMDIQVDLNETFATTNVLVAATRYKKDTKAAEVTGPSDSSQVTFGVRRKAREKVISQLALGGA